MYIPIRPLTIPQSVIDLLEDVREHRRLYEFECIRMFGVPPHIIDPTMYRTLHLSDNVAYRCDVKHTRIDNGD